MSTPARHTARGKMDDTPAGARTQCRDALDAACEAPRNLAPPASDDLDGSRHVCGCGNGVAPWEGRCAWCRMQERGDDRLLCHDGRGWPMVTAGPVVLIRQPCGCGCGMTVEQVTQPRLEPPAKTKTYNSSRRVHV